MARILVMTVAHPPLDARICHRQIAALLAHGHQVTYAAPFVSFQQEPPPGVRAHNLMLSKGSVPARAPAIVKAAIVALRERARHDVVLVHDPELLPVLAAARLPGRRRPVAIWDVHEDVPAQVSMLALPAWAKRLVAGGLHAVELLAERRVRLLLAERDYQSRFRRQHPVVPNSVRVAPGGPWPAEDRARVVYLGSLTWHRGARELVDLARLVPEVVFEVIGNAKPEVEEFLRAAGTELPNLDYQGFLPNDRALGRLPGALAGLSLLHDEPNYAHSEPTKVMEYMAHGVPTLTTPNPASKAMVEATGCGVVVGFGDVAGAAAAIRRLAGDRAHREALSANAYAAASAHDWNVDGPRFAELVGRWADAPRRS